jgi:uncharacterized protein
MSLKSGKIQRLKQILKEMKRVVLAYSGGVDSTFLLKTALDTLGRDNVLPITAKSDTFPKREYKLAKDITKKFGIKLVTIHTKELENETFIKNPINRCYYCKKELFKQLLSIARRKRFNFVIDGSNYDDRMDIRYGSKAARELGVRSPLAEARIGKKYIRRLSHQLHLPTWDKPSFACLASRFPYHHRITTKELKNIDKAEEFLYQCGFKQLRVRVHNEVARIEIARNEIKRLTLNERLLEKITKKLKQLGFSYVTLDLEGYRTGSMNEVLKKNKKDILAIENCKWSLSPKISKGIRK